jgi:hypothetical protein
MISESRIVLIEKRSNGIFGVVDLADYDSQHVLELIDIMFESKVKNKQELEITIPAEWMNSSVRKVLEDNNYEISKAMHGIYFVTKNS